jgi:hypothetical protein
MPSERGLIVTQHVRHSRRPSERNDVVARRSWCAVSSRHGTRRRVGWGHFGGPHQSLRGNPVGIVVSNATHRRQGHRASRSILLPAPQEKSLSRSTQSFLSMSNPGPPIRLAGRAGCPGGARSEAELGPASNHAPPIRLAGRAGCPGGARSEAELGPASNQKSRAALPCVVTNR